MPRRPGGLAVATANSCQLGILVLDQLESWTLDRHGSMAVMAAMAPWQKLLTSIIHYLV